MAEEKSGSLTAQTVTNPTTEDFTQRYNGEPYTVKAGETINYAKNVSFHIAYHLSAKILREEFPWSKKKTVDEKERNKEAVKFSQLLLYDNPKRRMALYKILHDVMAVQEAISKFPIVYRGYLEGGHLGTMDEYRAYVEKAGGTFEVSKPKDPTVETLQQQVNELRQLLEEKQEKEKPPVKKTQKTD